MTISVALSIGLAPGQFETNSDGNQNGSLL